jgi:non-ribosomal peptide synthetase-like protein
MALDQHLPTSDVDTPGRGPVPGPPPPAGSGVAAAEAGYAAALAAVLQVDRVPVDGNFFDDLGADSMLMARFCARVRKTADLPAVSMTDVYRFPTVRALAGARAVPVSTPVEDGFAEVLAAVLQVDQVPVDSHFFDDLGADSMVMARFCARVRKRDGLPSVSMKDVYQHPTVSGLALALAPATAVTGLPLRAPAEPSSRMVRPTPYPRQPTSDPRQERVGTLSFILCGALQFLAFVGYVYATSVVTVRASEWISAGSSLAMDYLRAVAFGGAVFLGMCVFPIVAKWVLVGRWQPRDIRVWSLTYFRFWLVKTLMRMNPLVLLFAGSPLYVLYLRALGANVGRGVAVFSRQVPACPDLLTIGDGTVICKDALISCYRARDGVIRTGRVTLGKNVFVSEATVLDIDTAMGDGAQLGHRSSLHTGQAVPAGERWHGSPGRPTQTDFLAIGPVPCGRSRRVGYSIAQLLNTLFVTVPLAVGGLALLLIAFPQLDELVTSGHLAMDDVGLYAKALAGSFVLLFGTLSVALLFVTTVPRVLHRAITPDRVYPLYGFHYSIHRGIARMTNVKPLTKLFGDSSYIVNFLTWLGYRLTPVVQTGSNFGTGVKHESPYLSTVGSGTMVADGLSLMNADYSSTSFRVSRATVGADNFLGNAIAFPSGARTGDDCLLATKVMVPTDGPMRKGVGLLGSPSFEIPRSVYRDAAFGDVTGGPGVHSRLRAKDRHNRHTIALFLLVRWIDVFAVTLLGLTGAAWYSIYGAWAIAASSVASVVFHEFYAALVERASTGFRRLQPQLCSIHDITFWRHERYWKLVARPDLLNGTPFKPLLWRLLGVRIGRRVFDDGCFIPERTLVTVGDFCTLNAGSTIQGHSQEDGGFKSDRITIGDGVTVGVGAWVHYGVVMGDRSELAPDSFLMKGEEVPAGARWGGNPAGEIHQEPAVLPPAPATDSHRREAALPSGRDRSPWPRATPAAAPATAGPRNH